MKNKIANLLLTLLALSAVSAAQQPDASPAIPKPTATADFTQIRKLMQQGQLDDAVAQLHALEAQDPAAKGLALELGTAYYRKNDFPQAIEYLKKANTADPANDEAVQMLGLAFFRGGHPAEAIPLLEKVQAWYPRANVDAAYVLGVAYIQTKNYDQARKSFATMFAVRADSAAAYLFTARMLLRQEYDPVAEEYAQKAATLDPKLPLVHFLLGELYLYKSRVPESIAEFEKEIALNPAHAATYYKLADAYSRVQKYDEADRLLQKSIWLDSTSTGPFILRGKILEKKGEFDLAVLALQRAATMDPNNPMTHQLLGQAYRNVGKKDDAERELKLAEKLQNSQTLR
jgi:tetratricopeptide (TPR) repeat protein